MTARYAPLAPLFVVALTACGATKPPPSMMPNAQSAVMRLDATYAGVTGISGSAKIDYLGDKGRVRGDVSVLASGPARLRFAITADVVGAAGEVATDGVKFQADDKGHGRYIIGAAKPCNIARITQVPLPLEELVPMLWGMRPHLEGPIKCDSIHWDDGHYVVMMSKNDNKSFSHELHVTPYPADFDKPWAEQRLRLLGVTTWDKESVVYRVTMKDHSATGMAKPMSDPDGLNPDVGLSGPVVSGVELPRTIHVEVPSKKSDVIFKYGEEFLNPPLIDGAFQLILKEGVPVDTSECN